MFGNAGNSFAAGSFSACRWRHRLSPRRYLRAGLTCRTAVMLVLMMLGISAGVSAQTFQLVTPMPSQTAGPAFARVFVIQGADGNFYGTTGGGGIELKGTIFKIDQNGTLTTIHEFLGSPSDGGFPYSGFIQAPDGFFYGTTELAGDNGGGTVFKATTSGAVTILHDFTDEDSGGYAVWSGLVRGSDGNFYGMTEFGGVGWGTIFKITPAGVFTKLHDFGGAPGGGAYPLGNLIQGSDGNFYGTTLFGGTSDVGTVFRMTPAGVVDIIHSFTEANNNGAYLSGPLLQRADGLLYGVAGGGGNSGFGTVFKIGTTPGSSPVVLHRFTGADGGSPQWALLDPGDGYLYGVARIGGASNVGTVYKLDPNGNPLTNLTTLHAFTGGSDGSSPLAGLIKGADGNLYGAASEGGLNGYGTFFRIAFNQAPVASNVHISGTLNVGQLLTGVYNYSDANGDVEGGTTFQWFGGLTPIGTALTYTTVAADLNQSLTFKVTPGAVTGTTPGAAVTSPPVTIVAPTNTAPAATGVAIAGIPNVGELLTGQYVYGDADNDAQGVSTYQWLRDGVTVVGTAITYTTVAADLGHTISFRVTPVAATGVTPGATVTSLSITIVPPASLPAPWVTQDVGSVSPAGSASASGGVFTLLGSGADIWYLTDAFRFVYQTISGDSAIIARVASQTNTNEWAKAGVMLRENTTAGARYVGFFATPSHGLTFQRRANANLATDYTPGSAVVPVWLKLVRSGNTFTASSSPDGVVWTVIGSDTFAMPASLLVGLAVTSHNNGVLSTATFDNVSATGVGSVALTLAANIPGLSLSFDGVSSTAPVNTSALTGSSHTIAAAPLQVVSGHYYQFVSWSDTGAASHAITTPALPTTYTATYVEVSPPPPVNITLASNIAGVSLTYDAAPGVQPVVNSAPVGSTHTIAAPLTQTISGTTYQFVSWSDGGAATHTITTPGVNTTYTATYANASTIWLSQVIGTATPAGSTDIASGVFTISGAGADIWDGADGFRYVYQPLAGDGEIIARVTGLVNTNPWAKAGLMFREDLSPGSRNAAVVMSAANGVAFQRRTLPGGLSTYTGASGSIPRWLRIVRAGNTFTAYGSPDGVAWTSIGSDTIAMGSSVWVGLAVTSHNNGVLTTATFDNVLLSSTGSVSLTLATNIPGLSLSYDGASSVSPSVTNAIVGSTHTIAAPASQTVGGHVYQFVSWSDTGAASHSITTPAVNTTYTATYQDVTPPVSITLASNPPGLSLTFDATPGVAPVVTPNVVVGSSHTITAPLTQTLGPDTYQFVSWSDGGAASHSIATPAANTTYTATYQNITSPTPVTVTLATNIAGLSLTLDSTTSVAPFGTSVIVGSSHTVTAPATQVVAGHTYQFVSWSDTGAASHTITPTVNTTYTATYQDVTQTWTSIDIGGASPAGTTNQAAGVFTIDASGADIWGTADSFRFVYQTLVGDGQIIARVTGVTNTHAWAKAGVMIRESLASNARNAAVMVSSASGSAWQRRTVPGGFSVYDAAFGAPPTWVKLVRSGSTFTAFTSTNGTTWVPVGSDTIPMGASVFVGIAVTSHNNGVLTTATVDSVSF